MSRWLKPKLSAGYTKPTPLQIWERELTFSTWKELKNAIKKELKTNPFLELSDRDIFIEDSNDKLLSKRDAYEQRELENGSLDANNDPFSYFNEIDIDWDELFPNSYADIVGGISPRDDPEFREDSSIDSFSTDPNEYNWDSTPEVLVEQVDNNYASKLHPDGIPRLKMNQMYKDFFERYGCERLLASFDEVKDVREKIARAGIITKVLYERCKLMLMISQAVIERQIKFLEQGTEYLVPLSRDDIELPKGANPYRVNQIFKETSIHTPRGVYSLNDFLSTECENDNK